MPTAWILRRKRDRYYRLAKEEGYRSRAAYKLLQAVEKYHFMKAGDMVVDLGAAPGGWMQAAKMIVGDTGYVFGVDLKPIEPFEWSNLTSIVGDVTDQRVVDLIRQRLPRRPDVVLSDVSPNISGVWEVDHARQIDLAEASLRVAVELLRAGGSFFAKVFQGDLLREFQDQVGSKFEFLKVLKPRASRAESSELYILGMDFVATNL